MNAGAGATAASRRPGLVNAAGLSAQSFAQYLIAFAASAVLSRALGPEGRGIYYLPVLAATTLVAMCKLGLDQANLFLAGSHAIPLGRLSAQNGLVAAVAGTVGGLVTLALPEILPRIMAGTNRGYLLLAALTIPFTLHAQYSAVLLAAAGHPARQYRAGMTAAALQLGLFLVMVTTGTTSVALALAITLAAAVATWIVMIAPLPALGGSWIAWDRALLLRTLRGSLVLHAGMVLLFFHLRVGMYMVKGALGDAALGQYSLAVVLGETLWLVTDAVSLAVLPSQMTGTLTDAALRALQAARANLVLATAAAAAWAAGGRLAIPLLFGPDFLPAYYTMLALLPGVAVLALQRACSTPTLRDGRPWRYSGIYAMAVACNVVLNVWMIPRWGLVGASAAWSLSCVVSAVLFLSWTGRLAGGGLRVHLTPSAADWSAVQGAIRHLRRVE